MRRLRRVAPAALRGRFDWREIVRSLDPGGTVEARAIGHRLWSDTDAPFMSMRLDTALSQGEIRAFGGRLLDTLRHETERELAGIEVEPDGSFGLGCWVEQTSVARDKKRSFSLLAMSEPAQSHPRRMDP